MIIPKQSKKLLKQSFLKDYGGVSKNPSFGAEKQFNISRINDRYLEIKKIVSNISNKNLRKMKILEVGSGSGMTVTALSLDNVFIRGIEPDLKSFKASQILLKANKLNKNLIRNGFGEKLPFNNNSFDLIISYQVLEHTEDPSKVLSECKRVLKKNGLIYFVMPNYHSFWEGHYALPWLPFFNKFLAKKYVKILGRDDSFIDSLNFVNPMLLKKWSKELNLEIISLGEDKLYENFNSKLRDYWSSNKMLSFLIKVFKIFNYRDILVKLLIKCSYQYPIIYIAKNNG